jgi:ferredoxin
MKIKNIECLVFSPTGSCLKIGNSIKSFLENRIEDYQIVLRDLTKPEIRETFYEMPFKTDYVIIIYPVFADNLPKIVAEYLWKLAISNLPVTLVAGFSSINIGKSLSNAKKIVEAKGNVVSSACAIVTAHSYNGDSLKIAVDEPSPEKLEHLYKFILKSMNKVENAKALTLCKTDFPEGHMRIMCRLPLKPLLQLFIKKPLVIPNLCNQCMVCAKNCPAGAIDAQLNIDKGKCIYCLACVKVCVKKARLFQPRTQMMVNQLKKGSKEMKKNEFYI